MGKLIQCCSKIAKNPYCFPMTKTNVYSIEEVCYYIRHNIYMMQEEIFDEEFVQWLRNELEMEVTADKLESMRRDHDNLKDIVVTLCCSCDYYSEEEINQLIDIMDETQNLSSRGRRRIKADSFLKTGSLERARKEYEAILRSDDMRNASQDDYGVIFHSLGVAYAGLGELRPAAQAFQKAYKLNEKMESLQGYLYTLQLGGMEREYQNAIRELGISTEQQVFLSAQYTEAVQQSKSSKRYRQIQRLQELLENGKYDEFSNKAGDMIQEWKEEYRQKMEA